MTSTTSGAAPHRPYRRGSTPATSTGAAGGGDFLDGGFPAKETPVKGGRLTIAYDSNIDCWNGLSYYGISWSYFYFMARGLYGYPNTVEQPATDTIQPEIAADMPTISADGLTYTVKLRQGIKFPDGSPVTAKDVKAHVRVHARSEHPVRDRRSAVVGLLQRDRRLRRLHQGDDRLEGRRQPWHLRHHGRR